MSTPTEPRHSSSTEENVSSPNATDSSQPAECGDPAELGLDVIFDALKNARRRRLLRYLKEENDRVKLSDLAEHLAAIENDTTLEALDSQQRKRVYVALYQAHLPKLDKMGILTFNQGRGLIERNPIASQLDKYLYIDEASSTGSWPRYYIECLAVTGVVLLLGTVTSLIGTIAAFSVFLGISVGVAVLAGFHTYEQREATEQNVFQQVSNLLSSPDSNSTDSESRDSNETADETEDSSSSDNMHECPECSTVYLSEEPCLCSNCNLKTTPVESTA